MKLIKLTQGKFAQVSDHRFEYLNQWKWFAQRSKDGLCWYAVRWEGKRPFRKIVLMHRVVTNAPDGTKVDHKDRDGLNNQDDNLRVCTHAENSCNRKKSKNNTSGYRGVSWHKRDKKWCANIAVNGKQIYLSSFSTEIEAALAYDKAAKQYHGAYASLNFKDQPNLESR